MMLLLSCTVSAFAGSVDFEGSNAPCYFANASPLTNAYAGQGVNFSSGNGAILDECASFGVNALSGTNFLAFNSGATNQDLSIPTTPEVISFDNPVFNVAIWVATPTGGSFSLSDNNGNHSTLSNISSGNWVLLSLADTNITSITLTGPGVFVADDLSWNNNWNDSPATVPEPSSLVLLGSSIASFLGVARKKMRM